MSISAVSTVSVSSLPKNLKYFRRIPADDRSNTKFEVIPKRVILHPDILPSKISSLNQQRLGKHPFYHDLILFEVPDLYDELAKKEGFRFESSEITNFPVSKSLRSKKTTKIFAIHTHAFRY